MSGRLSPDQRVQMALKLAPQGKCLCNVCDRVGPLNGAFVSWWAGVPVHALCPDCFGVGRRVLFVRRDDGVEARTLESERGPSIVLADRMPDVGEMFDPTALQRSASKGW